jgi:hypothetical protein
MGALVNGKLSIVYSAPGSTKLDQAASLDIFGLAASYQFTEKMKVQAVSLLEALEAWSEKQALGMELAQHQEKMSGSFESLLKVMDALYQVRVAAGRVLRRAGTAHLQPTACACGLCNMCWCTLL